WVEVGAQFAWQWRAFFQRLEQLHGLDHGDPAHLWLLHYLFLDEINEDWNSHPVSGEGHDQTPEDMHLIGRLEHGEYEDDCNGLDPTIIGRYYGVEDEEDNIEHNSSDSDSGSDIDNTDGVEAEDISTYTSSSSDETQNLPDHILKDVQSQFHHAPVWVPKHKNPFSTKLQRKVFNDCLVEVLESDAGLPSGLGIRQDEWEEEGYPIFETLKSGRRGTKELRIPLPLEDWLPRAEVWVKALTLMNNIMAVNNASE
ncbi:hypothetical protein F5051DRAFT_340235, partial [Lentinula edodes]